MAKHLVIIGAGTGGLMLSNHVARGLNREIEEGAVTVTLVGDRDEYIYQPGFLYVAFDMMRPAELIRKVTDLISPGVTFVHDRAVRVDTGTQMVETESGRRLPYDYLALSTGSELNLDEIEGLREGAHWFYTLDGAIRLREALKRFQGGRLVMAVGLPHKCPVAPLEFAFMFDEWTRERGIREKTEIVYTFPINGAHSIEPCSVWARGEFEKRNIHLETFFNMERVDPVAREIHSLEGISYAYDLLVAVPPHVGDPVGRASGLTNTSSFLVTDRHTLMAAGHENIFVIGDATNLPLSKAGSVAHFQAEALGENLINLLTGGSMAHLYNGKTFCFVEAGLHTASYLIFDYDHPPKMSPPTRATHWFKLAYNRIHWLNLKGIV